jgi:hypothetical protein
MRTMASEDSAHKLTRLSRITRMSKTARTSIRNSVSFRKFIDFFRRVNLIPSADQQIVNTGALIFQAKVPHLSEKSYFCCYS